jgi:hypothetical protein
MDGRRESTAVVHRLPSAQSHCVKNASVIDSQVNFPGAPKDAAHIQANAGRAYPYRSRHFRNAGNVATRERGGLRSRRAPIR